MPEQPLDLDPIKKYLCIAGKLGYSGRGIRHLHDLINEVEKLRNDLAWLRTATGQQYDFTGQRTFRCACCGVLALKEVAHVCEKGVVGA